MRALVFVAFSAVVAAVIVGVVAAKPVDAFPSEQKDCIACHGGGTYAATVTATPSSTTVAPGASYTVAITISENPSGRYNTGYWIAYSDANGATGTSTGVYGGDAGTQQSYTATMIAPATPGTYYYKVFGVDGPADSSAVVGYKVYSITVAAPGGDVAVRFLGSYPRVRHAAVGDLVGFHANYANVGTASATFSATLTATSPGGTTTTLDVRSVTLAAGATTKIYYPSVLAYTSPGRWTVTATAGPVPGETATADNTYVWSRTVLSAAAAGSRRAQRGR
jgi:hypothetical protein